MKTRVLIVDDHPLLRRGLREGLGQQPDMELAGEASNGTEAVKLALAAKPNLVLMDMHLPDLSGTEATQRILGAVPDAKVIVLSADADRPLVDAALQAGACGYILKNAAIDELLQAIKLVMAGKLYLSPEVSAGILEDYRQSLGGVGEPARPSLTDRDRKLLRLVAEGKRNKEIAVELMLSPNSIETCRARLMRKLGCSSSAEMIRYAIRQGIVAP